MSDLKMTNAKDYMEMVEQVTENAEAVYEANEAVERYIDSLDEESE